jgi:beta-glucosidase
MGLFDRPYSNTSLGSVRTTAHKEKAREAVRNSMVLLKNNTMLPLSKNEKIIVAGPYASRLGALCGGWTRTWQGMTASTGLFGTTILQGMQQISSNVTYDELGYNLGDASKVVVVMGERPYAEYNGDDATPQLNDVDFVENYSVLTRAIASGKPVILVLISGRPLVIESGVINSLKGIVAAWLPGTEGRGVADVLFGDYNFTGKLSFTWPSSLAQIPTNSNGVWNFGDGLRY